MKNVLKSLLPFVRLAVDMILCSFILYYLLFFSGIFYYPESDSWLGTVVFLSVVSGIAITAITTLAVFGVNELMNDDPNNGGHLILTIVVSVVIVSVGVILLGQNILHFHIIKSTNLVGVFLYIIFPTLLTTLFLRGDKHL